MRYIIRISILAVFFLFTIFQIHSQGYELKIKIKNLKNKNVILGHYFNSQLYPDDTIKLNNKGYGYIRGKKKFPGGMYFFFLPNHTRFDFIISDDQKFSIENDTIDFLKNVKVTGSIENSVFFEYQKFLANQRELAKKHKGDKKKLTEINKQVENEYLRLKEKHPKMFFIKFLTATMPVKIPKSITDNKQKYYYYRNHYLDNFDVSDARLLRTPIYKSTIETYLDKVVPPVPDSIIKEVDILINNARTTKELFRFMLVHLFNKYASSQLMGMENVYVHLAEKFYIPEAYWSDPEYIEELKEKIKRKKNCLLGMNAKDIKMIILPSNIDDIKAIKNQLTEIKNNGTKFIEDKAWIKKRFKEYKSKNNTNMTDSALKSQLLIRKLADIIEYDFFPSFDGYKSLYKTNSKYTILWFWEPDCSHCRKETPKLYKLYEEKLKKIGVQVYSIYLHKNINEWDKYTKHLEKWFDFLLDNKMTTWYNLWDPINYSNFRHNFDISGTPVLYLLDKNKKIIAKRISFEHASEIIERIEKNK